MSISIVVFSLYTGISPMPSSRSAQKTILKFLSCSGCLCHGLNKTIYELGSGWGGLAFKVSKSFPHAKLFAFEISPLPWLFSQWVKWIRGYSNIEIYRRNFYQQSLNEAEIIICYLYPGAMKKLKLKFESELKPGTLVISNTFSIPGWKPLYTLQLDNMWKTEILVYKV